MSRVNQTDPDKSNSQKNSQKASNAPQEKMPQTYLDLIEKVGGIGRYQYMITGVIACVWFATGSVLLSTAFFFLNPQFDCEAFGLITDECYEYVCSLPQAKWASFVTQQQNEFKSLANYFGDYYCDNSVYLDLYASSPYFGALIGFIFVTFFSDNYGRRKTVIAAWSIAVFGCLLIMLSKFTQLIWMAIVGLVLLGFGTDSVTIVTGSILSQQCQDVARQKIFAIVQGAFTVGALIITLVYYLWKDWFITVTFFLLIPVLITLAGFVYILKESPLYLIRDSPENALKQLNHIGQLNKGIPDILTMKDIENVIELQQSNEFQELSTPLDPFRYASLRLKTITQSIINICTFLLYYGPSLIIAQFGFNIYISNVILNVADISTYYPLMVIIDKIKRRKTIMIQFGGAVAICGTLIFLVAPEDCDDCYIIYLQLVLIFIFRFLISMEFAIVGIYQAELYPIRVRNISVGVLNVFGTVASTLAPIVMGYFTREGINHFILFTVLGILSLGAASFCPETLGMKCPEEIEEIAFLKIKRSANKRSSNYHSTDKLRLE